MKQASVKNAKQVKLNGISVEFVMRDGSIAEVQLRDSEGNSCVIAISSYSMHVYIPEPPKLVKKVRLHGTALGLPVDSVFAYKHEADAKLAEFNDAVRDDEAVALKVEEVEVPEDEVPF